MVKHIITLLIFVVSAKMIFAAQIVPRGQFLDDSVKIGQEIYYALSVQYPKDFQIVFPDSLHTYDDFEFYSKSYHNTRLRNGEAVDSVVYGLATFEIDPIQYLQLPIYLINHGDSVPILSNTDSVALVQYVNHVPDSIALIQNAAYYGVNYEFNYVYWSIGGGVFLISILLILLLFGRSIQKRIELYRMQKDYQRFVLELEKGISKVRANQSDKQLIEDVLVTWKIYMENLEHKPFRKLTTKEIEHAGYDQTLLTVLKSIDRAIYSTVTMDEIYRYFENLEDYTSTLYQQKTSALKNG